MALIYTYQHNGQSLEIADLEDTFQFLNKRPEAGAVRAPGAGQFELGPVRLSRSQVGSGESLTVSAHFEGRMLAYVFVELVLHDVANSRAFGPLVRSHLKAPLHKTIGNVEIPQWPAVLELKASLLPKLRIISDGSASAFGFLLPEQYGVSYQKAVDRVYGIYRPAGGGEARRAALQFSYRGQLLQLMVQAEAGAIGALRPFGFQAGDQFTPLVSVFESRDGLWQERFAQTNTLTFGKNGLRCLKQTLLPGSYLAGFALQDMDGKLHRSYASLTLI